MKLLLVGNGFDLAHGLPTSYVDFLRVCEGRAGEKHIDDKNIWYQHFLKQKGGLGDTWFSFENEIFNVLTNIEFMSFTTPTQILLEKNSILYVLERHKGYNKDYPGENDCGYFKDGNKVIIKSFKGLSKYLYDELTEFIKAFGLYLCERADNRVSDKIRPFNKLDKILRNYQGYDRVLSFNYTNTPGGVYGISPEKCCYIHGKFGDNPEKNNIVLGCRSFEKYLEIPVEFNIFTKHHQRNMKDTLREYKKLLIELNHYSEKTINVVGHSLDESDHDILSDVFRSTYRTQINVFYHEPEAQERLINNITEIIGSREVTKRVSFIHQEDEERGIFQPIKNSP